MDFALNILYLALTASFFILLIERLGIRENVQTRAPKLISDMFRCDFCLSFWVCVVLSVIFYIFVYRNARVFLAPILVTPLIRALL